MEAIRAFELYLESVAGTHGHSIQIKSKKELVEAQRIYTKSLVKQMYKRESGAKYISQTYRNRIKDYVLSGGRTFYDGGIEIIMTKSLRAGVEWQFTFIGKNVAGAIGRGDCEDMAEVLEYVREHDLVPIRSEWMEFV